MPAYDIIIRRSRLRGRGSTLYDIAITDGRIVAIEERVIDRAAAEIDARGNLVTESFVNPHLHLCKVYTLERLGEAALQAYHGEGMGAAMQAIEQAAQVKTHYEEAWILENVRRALAEAVCHGVTHIRAFADVDNKAQLVGISALLKAREEFRDRLEVQVVAFPQDGIVREPGAADLVREAMALGADVVGGIPWIEYTDRAAQEHIDAMFRIAREFDADISMLVDDAGDPGLRTLEMLAVKTMETDWHGRVLAHHARATALYPKPYLQKVTALMREAKMSLVSDPHTGPLHAPVQELLAAGVNVALGQDDISDAYYPYGRNNMLEVAFLASHVLWMTTARAMERLYDMITVNAARAMGISDYGLRVGNAAHLVVLTQPTILDALRYHEPPAYSIFHGRLIRAEDQNAGDTGVI